MANRYGDQVKVKFSELGNYTQKELKNKYKLSDRELLRQVHGHIDGASLDEKRKMLDHTYSSKGKS